MHFPMRRCVRAMGGALGLIAICGIGWRVLADCSAFGLPFTDLGSTVFCAEIAEAYYTGITNGTSPTTFSPKANVTREQMAAFTTRTLDAALSRGNRRAALGQWWTTTPHFDVGVGVTAVGNRPQLMSSDGADVWVANFDDATVTRVRASDGAVLGTWTGASSPGAVLVAMGRVFVTGQTSPGQLYMIDPTQAPGPVTVVAGNVGKIPTGIAFDGSRIWTANQGIQPLGVVDGSVSVITPGATTPWPVQTITTGFSQPFGMIFDGVNIWVTDDGVGKVLRLDASGAVLQSVSTDDSSSFAAGFFPAFDGRNLWVPNFDRNSLGVIRSSDGALLKVFSSVNGLELPVQAAFDGSRVLVTNSDGGSVSLFRATSLEPIGNPPTGGMNSYGVCSDGRDFWVSFSGTGNIGRF